MYFDKSFCKYQHLEHKEYQWGLSFNLTTLELLEPHQKVYFDNVILFHCYKIFKTVPSPEGLLLQVSQVSPSLTASVKMKTDEFDSIPNLFGSQSYLTSIVLYL